MLNGRKEHEEKLKAETLKSLEEYPPVLTKFFEEAGGGTMCSKRSYVSTAKQFVDFMITDCKVNMFVERSWRQVTERHILDFIKTTRISKARATFGKENSPKTSREAVLRLRALFDYLVLTRYVYRNPVPEDKVFNGIIPDETDETREIISMTPEEVKAVREHIYEKSRQPQRDVCMFMLGCRFGIRETAMASINVEDICKDKDGYDILRVNDKGNKVRDCELDEDSLCLIRTYLEVRGGDMEKGPLFTRQGSKTERISPNAVNNMVKKFTSFLPKHITAHKMRATAVTNTYNYTGNIYETAERVGHSNIENTKRYVDTKPQKRKLSRDFANDVY